MIDNFRRQLTGKEQTQCEDVVPVSLWLFHALWMNSRHRLVGSLNNVYVYPNGTLQILRTNFHHSPGSPAIRRLFSWDSRARSLVRVYLDKFVCCNRNSNAKQTLQRESTRYTLPAERPTMLNNAQSELATNSNKFDAHCLNTMFTS